jgi:hypothetical protein
MIDEPNPAFQLSRTPGRSVRLSVSLPPVQHARPCDGPSAPARPQAQAGFTAGARPMLRAALRVLQATRRIWREPLA